MRTILVSCVLGLAIGCSTAQPAPTESASPPPAATPTSSVGLSKDAKAGQALFAVCDSCHNAELHPPKGPPMFGVQRRYNRATEGRAEFVARLVAHVTAPTEEKALMKMAVEKLGLMPPLPLGDAPLRKIAAYIYEAEFAPPCGHWKNAMGAPDSQQSKKHHRMMNKFCK